ncbi:tetratricopeptide repeat protein [Dechloromonas denitrificans]|uniref:tetratricopeptide repeat protein n=1 Tax=Dechloromonas denitrificans TaxID=281362 RepID=UPI001CFA09B5|nr:tetratricopeptide repeat protein [Dechloromonas denitrificans]UCV08340.1 tetratricopeptide repeat protein [Dechloromonas denitrificans]
MNPRIESLEKMLDGPRDGALLRFSLGNEYLKAGDPAKAGKCFQEAVDRDSQYSAAWKALGKALAEAGEHVAALAAYERGISVAESKGDIQAAKEMTVFARRIRNALGG